MPLYSLGYAVEGLDPLVNNNNLIYNAHSGEKISNRKRVVNKVCKASNFPMEGRLLFITVVLPRVGVGD